MMKKERIEIDYTACASAEELQEADRELFGKAVEAVNGSYAPYSHFHVGAAVLLADGHVVCGANQENAASPSGLCAERTALFYAHANYPGIPVRAIAIAARREGSQAFSPAYPCGACRQVLAESQKRAGADIRIIVGDRDRILVFGSVDALLPFIFDSASMD